jgi:hypothetical protein
MNTERNRDFIRPPSSERREFERVTLEHWLVCSNCNSPFVILGPSREDLEDPVCRSCRRAAVRP